MDSALEDVAEFPPRACQDRGRKVAQRYSAPARGLQATVVPGPSSNVPGTYSGTDTSKDGATDEWYGEERRQGPPARWWQQCAGEPGRAARQHLAGGPRRCTGTWPALLCRTMRLIVVETWWTRAGRAPGQGCRPAVLRAGHRGGGARPRASDNRRGTVPPHGHPRDREGAGRASSQPAREQAAGAGPPGIDGRHRPVRGFGSLAGAARFCSARDELRDYPRHPIRMHEVVPLEVRREQFRARPGAPRAMLNRA